MKKIKGIVFDMDGVLVDAKEWHYESLNKALEFFGFSISRSDHENKFDGLPTSKKLEMISKNENLPTELHTFINKLKQKFTMQMVYNFCKPRFKQKQKIVALCRKTTASRKDKTPNHYHGY